ncbi:MAG: PEP-CTERM sorting domain-containing protein [Cyanobacterium sp. T60_A2020_053]|nr:PEP-CTERM sorting domain-containing protein [Cyanobacterium sp. T60_A2020_053]
MKKSTLSTLLVSGLIAPTAMIGLTATGAGAAALITIDNFTNPTAPSPLTSNGSLVTSPQTGLSGVFGGDRTSGVDKGTGGLADATLQIFSGGGLAFTQSPTTAGSVFGLNYTNTTGLNLDGFDSVEFNITDLTPNVDFGLNINGVTQTQTATATGLFSFDLTSFSNYSSFSNITQLVLGATGSPGFRVEITGALAAVDVPEPSALGGLLVFGLLGFATAKKRSNKSEEN